jgi:proline dehydrogenase
VDDYENRWALPDWHSTLLWCRARNSQGMRCVIDVLGEYAKTIEQEEAATQAYLECARNIGQGRLNASVSVKLTAMGALADQARCLQNTLRVAKEAAHWTLPFEIDMEGRNIVDQTIDIAMACKATGYDTTLAIQAYLDRTPADLMRIIDTKIKPRVVKGAYSGDANDFVDIQGRFKRLVDVCLNRGVSFCVGTHDPELIEWVTGRSAEVSHLVEFGMLKGLGDMTKVEFVKNKWKVSEYVPFGEDRAGYDDRRRIYLKRLEDLGRKPAP